MEIIDESTVYPELPLKGRGKLTYNWIPTCKTLLDAGCSWGYHTRFYQDKADNVFGIDPNHKSIKVAQQRYPSIKFIYSLLENTPFTTNFFDTIVLNDVIEHVRNEKECLNEIFRILQPSGTLIITTPHRGLFEILDPVNYKFRLKLNKKYQPPGYEHFHRHYTLKNLVSLLNQTSFRNKYKIDTVFKSGLFIEVLTSNLFHIFDRLFGKNISYKLIKPFGFLSIIDYWIPYGYLSYNIALKIIKTYP